MHDDEDPNALFGSDSDCDSEADLQAPPQPPPPPVRPSPPRVAGPGLFPEAYNPARYGPIHLAEALPDVGGGRGYVAATALPPGTLLMSETPLMRYDDLPSDPTTPFEVRVLQRLLAQANASALLLALAPLYPMSLQDFSDQAEVLV